MAARQAAPNLGALEESYRIVGELRGSEGVRKYMAARRDDGTEVVITVLSAPAGSANIELSHFAADAQLLSKLAHPGMARVFDARWIDTGTLAVVTQRVQGTTLAESLRAGEVFSNPRTASVLQEIWGVLDWARSNGVVNRGVTPDNVYFEPGTQHVTVVLGPTPLSVEGVNDMRGDARAIGSLAWSMITGRQFEPDQGGPPLEEQAPNLALRVADATETMVYGPEGDGQEPDVSTYIGLVAAGDVLKQAEVELAAMKEEYEEQHRIALAQCENHRRETERMATEQAELLASERADFERTMSTHQEQLAAVHEELQQQTAALERRIGDFERRRTDINRLRSEQEERIESSRRAREQAASEAETDIARNEREAMRNERQDIRSIVGLPRKPQQRRHDTLRPTFDEHEEARPRWIIPTVAVAFVLLVAAVVGGILYRNHANAEARRIAASKPAAAPRQRSAAGTVVPGGITPPANPATDTLGGAAAGVPPIDTTRAAMSPADPMRPDDVPGSPRPRPTRPSTDANANAAAPITSAPTTNAPTAPGPAPVTVPPADPARSNPVWGRTDSVMRADSARRDTGLRDPAVRDPIYGRDPASRDTPHLDSARRDSARRDSAVRRSGRFGFDTVRIRRDTTGVAPDSVVRIRPP